MPSSHGRQSARARKAPLEWRLAIVAVGVALLVPGWLLAALWFGAGWQDTAWETRCYAGQPAFALGQAAVAFIGLSLGAGGVIGTARAVRRRRHAQRPVYLLFAAAAFAFGTWLTVVINQPVRPTIDGSHCFAQADQLVALSPTTAPNNAYPRLDAPDVQPSQ